MDRQVLQQRMESSMRQVAERVAAQASASLQDMAEVERLIYGEMDQLKASALQSWVQEAEDDTERPSCPHCGQRMRQKQDSPKTSTCVGGSVTVQRTRWWCGACGASFFPSG